MAGTVSGWDDPDMMERGSIFDHKYGCRMAAVCLKACIVTTEFFQFYYSCEESGAEC